MRKVKLNSLRRSDLQKEKLQELDTLSIREKQKIFGGAAGHKVGTGCAWCDDDQCDGMYVNNNVIEG